MAIYSVYLPPVTNGHPQNRLDGIRFVRDGFSWSAFIIPVIWLLWHRAWGAFAVILLIDIGLAISGTRFGLPGPTVTLAGILVMVYVGLEARNLYAGALERRQFQLADIVYGRSLSEAETRFFERFGETHPDTATSVPAPGGANTRIPSVIGLFPEGDRRP